MADVAKQAKVHPTTVSLALRNHPSLPERTRSRIQALALKMGYTPDPAWRALVEYRMGAKTTKSPVRLAYLTHWRSRFGWRDAPAHREFFEGAAGEAKRLGYEMEHHWLGARGMTKDRLRSLLNERRISGALLASHSSEPGREAVFDWTGVNVVKIDYYPRACQVHNVTNDQRSIIQLAMRRIRQAGYRRIGFVMPVWWDAFVDSAWSSGFLVEQSLTPVAERVPILLFENGDSKRAARPSPQAPEARPVSAARLREWLDRHQVEVVVSYAPFVEETFAELGLSIPQDLAYVDIFRTSATAGAVAGVRQNCERVGQLAVEILDRQFRQKQAGVPEVPVTTMVEGTWFDGASLPPHASQVAMST